MRFFPSKSSSPRDLAIAFEVHAQTAATAVGRRRFDEARSHLDQALACARACLPAQGGGALVGAMIEQDLHALSIAAPALDAVRIEALAVLVDRAALATLRIVVRSSTGAVEAGLSGERLTAILTFVEGLVARTDDIDDVLAAAISVHRGDLLQRGGDTDGAVHCWLRARQRYVAALGEDTELVARLDQKLAGCDMAPLPTARIRGAMTPRHAIV
jgi:hypothetical protein